MGWWRIGPVEINGDWPADQVAEHLPKLLAHHGNGETDLTQATLVALLEDFTAAVAAEIRDDYASLLPDRELVGLRCELDDGVIDIEAAAEPSKPMAELFKGLGMCWKDSGADRWPSARELCAAFDFVVGSGVTCEGQRIKSVAPHVTFSGPRLTLKQTAVSLVLALKQVEAELQTVRLANAEREVLVGSSEASPFEHDASEELFEAIGALLFGDRAKLLAELLNERPERFPQVEQLELS